MGKRKLIKVKTGNMNSMFPRLILRIIPFNANNKKPLNEDDTVTHMEDGVTHTLRIKATAPTPITDVEMITLMGVFKMVLDTNGEGDKLGVLSVNAKDSDFVKVKFDLRPLVKSMYKGNIRTENKARVFLALRRLTGVNLSIDYNGNSFTGNWFQNVERKYSNPNIIKCLVNKKLLNMAGSGMVYNFDALVKYKGNTALLYAFMQMFKHGKKSKSVYNNTIPYEGVVVALNLGSGINKSRINAEINKCFIELHRNGLPMYKLTVLNNGARSYKKQVSKVRPS